MRKAYPAANMEGTAIPKGRKKKNKTKFFGS